MLGLASSGSYCKPTRWSNFSFNFSLIICHQIADWTNLFSAIEEGRMYIQHKLLDNLSLKAFSKLQVWWSDKCFQFIPKVLDGVEVMSPSFPYAPLNPHPPQKISTPDGYIYIFLLLWIFRFYNTVNCSVILSVNFSPIRGMSGLNVAFLTHWESLLETGCRTPSKFPEEMIEDLYFNLAWESIIREMVS